VAEDLLVHPGLSSEIRRTLQENRPAFLLGNTAPDVQTVSGQAREVTHFFDLPIRPGMPAAWDGMLSAYPELARPARLASDQAAFIAGYLCHLQADWLWVLQVFAPVFGPHNTWRTFSHRLYLHNVLRAYLDQQIFPDLPAAMGADLEKAIPFHWLPFVADLYLVEWRDFLARQLQPGAIVETVEVFAARQGISPQEYYRLLQSEELLEQEIFVRLPRRDLLSYRDGLITANVSLLQTYFNKESL
jgi:hypothetical protein